MSADQQSRLREEFSLTYGCPIDFFNRPGTFIRVRESQAGKNRVYLNRYEDWSFLTVAPEDENVFRDAVDPSRPAVPGAFPPTRRAAGLHERFHCLLLPPEAHPRWEPASGYQLKEHDPADHPLLESFLERCTPEEIDDADIDLDDPDDAIVLGMKGDEPIAYSGYRILEKHLGDLGILVLPGHRRKGLALATLSRSIEICRKRNYIPLYRHWDGNRNSAAVAARLGFRRTYCVEVYDLEP